MKIALIGYGKMGKAIEQVAKQRGHEIVAIIDKDENKDDLTKADVAIEFTTPQSAVDNYLECFENNIPVVSGTTGWLDRYDFVTEVCEQKNQAFLYASNFSIGVNVFFELNRKLADLMGRYPEYKVSMEEIHHTEKLDAPSGTAISLANDIIKRHPKKTAWGLDVEAEDILSITAKRINRTPGTHKVIYESEVDSIEIEHQAKSREGFAIGAILAAEFIKDKTGVFSMQDLLHL